MYINKKKFLQNDIISYINTMNEIEYCIYNQEHDSNWDIDWNILWLLVLLYYNKIIMKGEILQ